MKRNTALAIVIVVITVIFFVVTIRALDRGQTTVEDVLEPNETFSESFLY